MKILLSIIAFALTLFAGEASASSYSCTTGTLNGTNCITTYTATNAIDCSVNGIRNFIIATDTASAFYVPYSSSMLAPNYFVINENETNYAANGFTNGNQTYYYTISGVTLVSPTKCTWTQQSTWIGCYGVATVNAATAANSDLITYNPTTYVATDTGTLSSLFPKLPACPSGGVLSGSTCTITTPAIVSMLCHGTDVLSANGATCQPATLYAVPTYHYSCLDHDNNGVTDTLVTATTCRPDLLAYTGEPVLYCPVITGLFSDPAPIVAGTATWSLNGSLQTVSGYTVAGPVQLPGPASHPIASSKKWVGGTTCSYQPPTVDATYAFTTYTCANGYVPDSTGMYCIPPKTPSASVLSIISSCLSNDVLSGSICTPNLLTYSPVQLTSYACPSTYPAAVLNPAIGTCTLPLQTAAPTLVSTTVCGTNAKLNPVTNMCDYVAIPATNNGGQYSCPALYTVGTGSNVGWCMPTPQWAYPATWNLTKYECPNGGVLGLLANNQPNGLCYLP